MPAASSKQNSASVALLARIKAAGASKNRLTSSDHFMLYAVTQPWPRPAITDNVWILRKQQPDRCWNLTDGGDEGSAAAGNGWRCEGPQTVRTDYSEASSLCLARKSTPRMGRETAASTKVQVKTSLPKVSWWLT
jgi:hypothetical protein